MSIPLHPMIVHFPIAITFLLPILIFVFAWFIKKNKMNKSAWLVIVFLELTVVLTGYIAIATGENEEDRVEKVVEGKLIGAHEDAAKIFLGSVVIVLVLSIGAYFVSSQVSAPMRLGIGILSIVSCLLAARAGNLGGELVYVHGAASVYGADEKMQGESLLPTPGMNTSESPMPINDEENESYKQDDNDYGGTDKVEEFSVEGDE